MPVIQGKYYMNPRMGEALEAARGRALDENSHDAQAGEYDQQNGRPKGRNAGGEKDGKEQTERDDRGRFRAPGKVHHVEIECADGGYVAHVARHPDASDARGDGQPAPLRRSAHVFTDHRDLVEFLRDELGKHQA